MGRVHPLFLAHLPCKKVAEELGVTAKTAWFMRVRILEAMFNDLPAFLVKDSCSAQLDELYFRESFKGTHFDRMPSLPANRGRGTAET